MIGTIAHLVAPLLDKLIPDVDARRKAKDDLTRLESEGDLDLLKAQLAVNAAEAKHESIFVAGWRPAVGWVCAFGLLYATFLENVLAAWVPHLPQTGAETLMPVLMGMLGIGGARTFEKVRGANNRR